MNRFEPTVNLVFHHPPFSFQFHQLKIPLCLNNVFQCIHSPFHPKIERTNARYNFPRGWRQPGLINTQCSGEKPIWDSIWCHYWFAFSTNVAKSKVVEKHIGNGRGCEWCLNRNERTPIPDTDGYRPGTEVLMPFQPSATPGQRHRLKYPLLQSFD